MLEEKTTSGYLFDARDVRDRELLEIALEFLVVSRGGLVHDLLLPSRGALQQGGSTCNVMMHDNVSVFHAPKQGPQRTGEKKARTLPPVRTCAAFCCNFLIFSEFIVEQNTSALCEIATV